jgi:hypothetical protein
VREDQKLKLNFIFFRVTMRFAVFWATKREIIAPFECVPPDARNTIGYCDARETVAPAECALSDARNTARDREAL